MHITRSENNKDKEEGKSRKSEREPTGWREKQQGTSVRVQALLYKPHKFL